MNEHVFAPLNQNQFDALVSFVFNIGVRAFRGSPTLRRLNEGRPLEAALAMEMWRKADLEGERIVIDALVRRRAAEKALFLRPVDGWIARPDARCCRRRSTTTLASMMPLHTPIATRTPMAGDRAYAERAPESPRLEPPEPPSASAAAAAAVIERLEAILSETEAEPGDRRRRRRPHRTGRAAPPSGEAAAEVGRRHALRDAVHPGRRREAAAPSRRAHPLLFLALAALGVGLFMLAALWGFQPQAVEVLGVVVADRGPGGRRARRRLPCGRRSTSCSIASACRATGLTRSIRTAPLKCRMTARPRGGLQAAGSLAAAALC